MKTYEASRLADGNKLFPPKVIVERTGLRVITPGVFRSKEVLIEYPEIRNISLNTPLVGFSTITFEARYETYKLHGFAKKDVKEIERYIRLGQSDKERLLKEIGESSFIKNDGESFSEDYSRQHEEYSLDDKEEPTNYSADEIESAKKELKEELLENKEYWEEEINSDKEYWEEELNGTIRDWEEELNAYKESFENDMNAASDEEERKELQKEYENDCNAAINKRNEDWTGEVEKYRNNKNDYIEKFEKEQNDKISSFEKEYGVKYDLEIPTLEFQELPEEFLRQYGSLVKKEDIKDEPVETVNPTNITPPPPPAFSFYAMIENKQQGPYNRVQFKRLVDNDLVSKNTYVWREGMSQWQYAKDVPEMAEFFPEVSTPPSIPAGPPPLPNS